MGEGACVVDCGSNGACADSGGVFAPCGVPLFASAVIITANGVNLAMDYVYIGVRKISRFLGLIMKFGRRPQNEAPVLDATIVLGDEAVSVRSAIAADEMAVYSRNHMKKSDYMDIISGIIINRA